MRAPTRTRLWSRLALRLIVGAALGHAFGLVGCATLPKPQALKVAEEKEQQPLTQEAAQLAPQAFAHAQQLRERAEQALADGDRERADILGEHALAAYQRVIVQARLVRAEQRIADAQRALSDAQAELARLTAAQQSAEAEAKAYELRARVIRDAEPLAPIEPANPAREAARRKAALSITEVARLLCLSAHMLDEPKSEPIRPLRTRLDALDQKLRAGAGRAPIDEAIALRSECLKALTASRREARTQEPETDPADELFVQLKQAMPEAQPIRDDRGIVVVVNDLFTTGSVLQLTPAGKEAVAKLSRIAQANPDFPLLVVLHGKPTRIASQKAALQGEFAKLGAASVQFHESGERIPAAVAPVAGAPARDERVEFVLVAPR